MAKKSKSNSVDSLKHKDKRKNIPTAELKDFVQEDEVKPKNILYPRDPSLDPQLVWKGKDEQDQKPFEIPAVPVYIQEKIHPQVLIDDLRRISSKAEPEQTSLFADFNGIKFEDLIDFYQHEQNWSNRMILGDSLLVMNSLAEKEGLKGKVQMIYFDPPYGIKFGSNWQVSTRKRDIKDGKAEDLTRQPEQIRAFRDTWELGIHSYLSYLRDRFVIARELLTETGSVFVQIGDENVHLVRCLMDEVFGSENFVGVIPFRKKTMPLGAKYLDSMNDYLIWYAKDYVQLKYHQIYIDYVPEKKSRWLLQGNNEWYRLVSLRAPGYTAENDYSAKFEGKIYGFSSGFSWIVSKEKLEKLIKLGRIKAEGDSLSYIMFNSDFPYQKLTNFWNDTSGPMQRNYVVETSNFVIERCLLMTTDPGDLVLDPTCGSGTTAYVAEQRGRRWITCDTSRVALALARTRLMSAKYPYYILSDTNEGIMKEAEISGHLPQTPFPKTEGDIKKGFVYKRVPHITLKSIANDLPAETEILYDQPYENNKRIRVTGPFTVESLSPHRILSADEERPKSEKPDEKTRGYGQFETMIIENLKKAGIQNTVKNERLKFDRLESYAGLCIHAEGDYTENKQSKRAAICIGPEHGTVNSEIVKEAAKEAVRGAGFDLLIVCGFAFDPHASETARQFMPEPLKKSKNLIVSENRRQYGKLTVLLARMNPDLAMGDELLKKTGAGNLFMVFGEPDIEIKKLKDNMMAIEMKGLDVYDPTTGQIRSHSTDDIACWFIDTDYNEESFFVRHAYFSGADEPYEKLKKALKAEIDEPAWSTLYSTKSRPFPMPSKGKIAVKVINHYGDEVLKVYEIT